MHQRYVPFFMKRFLLLILLGLSSCKRHQGSAIPIVKFPDPETQFIQRNQIDTTFIIYPQGTQGPDIKTYKTYDINGQVLFDNTSMVESVWTYYNNGGLPVKVEFGHRDKDGWDVSTDSALYNFDKERSILEQT